MLVEPRRGSARIAGAETRHYEVIAVPVPYEVIAVPVPIGETAGPPPPRCRPLLTSRGVRPDPSAPAVLVV
jgi:hypothetical protein